MRPFRRISRCRGHFHLRLSAVAFARPYRSPPPPRPLGLFSAVLPIAPLSRQIPSWRRRQPPAVRPPPYRSSRHRINSLAPNGHRLESASCLRRINIYLASCPMSPVNAPPSVIVKCHRRRILLVPRSFKLPSSRQENICMSKSLLLLFIYFTHLKEKIFWWQTTRTPGPAVTYSYHWS